MLGRRRRKDLSLCSSTLCHRQHWTRSASEVRSIVERDRGIDLVLVAALRAATCDLAGAVVVEIFSHAIRIVCEIVDSFKLRIWSDGSEGEGLQSSKHNDQGDKSEPCLYMSH